MPRLSPAQLRQRLEFDFAVVQRMSGSTWEAEGYRSAEDLKRRVHPNTDPAAAGDVTKYRVTFHVPTLVNPGEFADTTVVALDLAVDNYPYEPPTTRVLTRIPYSPHFHPGRGVCLETGGWWQQQRGRILLGGLLNHIARLLNWDEVARGGNYGGWNPAAIAYHRSHYGDRPLNPELTYPVLPVDLTHGIHILDEELFSPSVDGGLRNGQGRQCSTDLFEHS